MADFFYRRRWWIAAAAGVFGLFFVLRLQSAAPPPPGVTGTVSNLVNASIGTVMVALVAMGLVLIFHVRWLPVKIAKARGHPDLAGIRVCTLLSLLVWPLWLVALVWAYQAPRRPRIVDATPHALD